MALIYKFITDPESKEFNESERSFVAWASKSSIDRQDEEIDANGWIKDNYEKNPVVPLFHDYGRFPIAKAEWVKKSPRVNPEGLLFKPVFAKTEIGEEAFYLYKEGFMNAFSVGFDPLEWADQDGKIYTKAIDGEFGIWQKDFIQKKRKKPRCKYLKQELFEISGVLVPAHPEALVEARSIVKTKELSDYLDNIIKSRQHFISDPADDPETNLNKLIIIMDSRLEAIEKLLIEKDTIDASEYECEDEEIDIGLEDDLEIEITQDGEIDIDLETLVEV
jgi:phage head maturation protease